MTPRSRAELLDSFTGWGHDALKLLSCIESPSAWSIHAIDPPLGSYSRGQVAILGDAAHGMLPHLGAGAGQGIEDALVIVTLLKHPRVSKSNIEVCPNLCLFCFGFFSISVKGGSQSVLTRTPAPCDSSAQGEYPYRGDL